MQTRTALDPPFRVVQPFIFVETGRHEAREDSKERRMLCMQPFECGCSSKMTASKPVKMRKLICMGEGLYMPSGTARTHKKYFVHTRTVLYAAN